MAIFWGEKLWRNKGQKAGGKLLCGKKAKFLEENKIQVYLAYRLLAAQIGLNHLSLPCHTLTIMHFIFQLLYQVGTLVVAHYALKGGGVRKMLQTAKTLLAKLVGYIEWSNVQP